MLSVSVESVFLLAFLEWFPFCEQVSLMRLETWPWAETLGEGGEEVCPVGIRRPRLCDVFGKHRSGFMYVWVHLQNSVGSAAACAIPWFLLLLLIRLRCKDEF